MESAGLHGFLLVQGLGCRVGDLLSLADRGSLHEGFRVESLGLNWDLGFRFRGLGV